MQKHSDIGYRILRASPPLKKAAEIVLQHHERFDGTGYPKGLRGTEISLGARIFGVVDAYDSMRSVRVYRQPMSPEAAMKELRENSGTQFDPEVVEVFLQHQAELEEMLAVERR